jgi:hypothetical protein
MGSGSSTTSNGGRQALVVLGVWCIVVVFANLLADALPDGSAGVGLAVPDLRSPSADVHWRRVNLSQYRPGRSDHERPPFDVQLGRLPGRDHRHRSARDVHHPGPICTCSGPSSPSPCSRPGSSPRDSLTGWPGRCSESPGCWCSARSSSSAGSPVGSPTGPGA